MKLKILFSIAVIAFFSTHAKAQDSTQKVMTQPQNAIYAELGGQSLLGITLNYERFISKKPGGLSFKVGFGGGVAFAFEGAGAVYGALPLGLSYNIPTGSNKRSFFELGGGYTYLFAQGHASLINSVVGWRYDLKPGGAHIRLSVFPFMYLPEEKVFGGPWFGFSIGTRF